MFLFPVLFQLSHFLLQSAGKRYICSLVDANLSIFCRSEVTAGRRISAVGEKVCGSAQYPPGKHHAATRHRVLNPSHRYQVSVAETCGGPGDVWRPVGLVGWKDVGPRFGQLALKGSGAWMGISHSFQCNYSKYFSSCSRISYQFGARG